MSYTSLLTRPIPLIQMGNFFEFFDLFLSIHMTALLNSVFFPEASPLFSVFTFCLTFVLRPAGALLFGYLGDTYGRKSMIVTTTFLMGMCSLGIALLPSYNSMGWMASVSFMALRMLQGLSSVGETAGCYTYMVETIQPPTVHFQLTLTDFFADVGSFTALLVSTLCLSIDPVQGWRYAFLFGAITALMGGIARKRLSETPTFQKTQTLKQLIPQGTDKKNLLYYALVECTMPLSIYFVYIYMGNILKTDYGLSDGEVMQHNTKVACLEAIWVLSYAFLSLKINPLLILRTRIVGFLVYLTSLPILLHQAGSTLHILIIQALFTLLGRGADPAHALFIKSFPSMRRYTQTALAFALPRMLMYVITAYGCVFLHQAFEFKGIAGLFIIFTSLSLLGAINFKGVRHG